MYGFFEDEPTVLDILFEERKRIEPNILHIDANLAVIEKCDYKRDTGALMHREVKLVPKYLAHEIAKLYNDREAATEQTLGRKPDHLEYRRTVATVLPLHQYTTQEAKELIERLKGEIIYRNDLVPKDAAS